jgi:hypothetical protein
MPMPDTTQARKAALKEREETQNGGNGGAYLPDQLEETPGLWVLEKNWRHRLETAAAEADQIGLDGLSLKHRRGQQQQAEMVEFTVGVLGSGQVFGELAVLDCETLSPVSAISATAVEIFCFDINAMAHVQWYVSSKLFSIFILMLNSFLFLYSSLFCSHTHAKTMNILTESLTLHDPPIDKVAYYFRAKYNWELRKTSLMKRLKKL